MALSIPDTAVCLGCRYQLRGLENPVCPECGRRFNPDDRGTFGDLFGRGLLWRWSQPAHNWLRYFVMAWAALAVVTFSELGIYLVAYPFGWQCYSRHHWQNFIATAVDAYVLGACVLIGIQHFARWRLSVRARLMGFPAPAIKLMRWWWAPICLALVLSTSLYPWPMWLKFQVSRPALEADAKRQLSVGIGTLNDKISGGFLLDAIRVYSGPVALLTFKGSPKSGFVYAPKPDWKRDRAIRLNAHWFYVPRWDDSF